MDLVVISDTLASMIRMATPLTLMALGGLLCQRAGVFNIALEGFSLIGAFAAVAFVQFSGGNVYVGLIGAMATGVLYSCIYALFVTKFRANNIIAGIAMNMMSAGLTSYLLRAIFNVQGAYSPDKIEKLDVIRIPLLNKIPILNSLSNQSIVTYFTIALVVISYVLLFKTKLGLAICSVGESEVAAKTAGIKPQIIKWKVILMSGALCGLGGAYLSVISVSQFSEGMIQGRGFNAFTAFIFGAAHPIFASLVTLLFGFADAIGIRIELLGMNMSPSIIKMFPFLFAIIALIISSYTVKRKRMGKTGK